MAIPQVPAEALTAKLTGNQVFTQEYDLIDNRDQQKVGSMINKFGFYQVETLDDTVVFVAAGFDAAFKGAQNYFAGVH